MDHTTLLERVDALAEGLRVIGVDRGAHVAIWSENRPEWLIADLAINKLGAVSVPIHTVANRANAEHILVHSESMFLIVSAGIAEKNPDLPHQALRRVVVIGETVPEALQSDTTMLFKDLFDLRSTALMLPENASEIASIVYTSGTTGLPKGVVLTNRNFLANIEATTARIPIFPTDVFLSFLPLSHILERTAGSFLPMLSGASIAYAENIPSLRSNMEEIRPTVLVSVPKIFERIYEEVFHKASHAPAWRKKLFFWALKHRKGVRGHIASILVYQKIRNVFGGRMRIAVSGGASIDARILRFFARVGVPIIEGYGLTETAAAVTVTTLTDDRPGTVGRPIPGVEIRLAEDREILIKGNVVTAGYWNDAHQTHNALTPDGWLKTGDIGSIDTDSFLTIVGRKKDIIVCSNGKNIAPEKLEGLLNLEECISQSLVIGHRRPFLIALLVPSPRIPQDKAERILRECVERLNKELEPHERIRDIAIVPAPFTMEADELTPTLKVRRHIIEQRHRTLIERSYKKAPGPKVSERL